MLALRFAVTISCFVLTSTHPTYVGCDFLSNRMNPSENVMTTNQKIMFSPPKDDDSLVVPSATTFSAGSTVTITFSNTFVQGFAHATAGQFTASQFLGTPDATVSQCTGSNTMKYKTSLVPTQSIIWTAPANVDLLPSVTLSFAGAPRFGTVSRHTLTLTRQAHNPECISHETLKCINDASLFWPRCDPSQSKQDNFPPLHGRTPNDYGHFCTRSWADALSAMLSHPSINKCGDTEAHIKLLAEVAVETGYFTTLFQPADGGAGLVHMIPGNWPVNAQDMEALFGGNFVQRQAAAGAAFFQTPRDGWLSVAAWYKQTNRVIPGCGKDLFEESFETQTRCIFGRPNDRNEALNIVKRCFGTGPTTTRRSSGGCTGAPCSDATLCRSKWGHCGSSADHCNDESIWKAGGCGSTSSTSTTSSSIPASTITSTTTTTHATTVPPTVAPVGIQSGDVIFLKTRAGNGKHIDVESSQVQARWDSQGTWQALEILKQSSGSIQSGDTIYLRSHAGVHIDVTDAGVMARWGDQGDWQALIIEKKFGDGTIFSHDLVCLRSKNTGKHLDVQDDHVRARWPDCGDWQTMQVQREVAGAVFSGGLVHLVAHTGNLVHVEGTAVRAAWGERGLWQSLRIFNYGGRVVFSGDVVFLKAHTGAMIDVEGTSVQCRWDARGDWQKLILERKDGQGPVLPGDQIFLRSIHTGNTIDVDGASVQARWSEAGTWQTLTIEKAAATRRLAGVVVV